MFGDLRGHFRLESEPVFAQLNSRKNLAPEYFKNPYSFYQNETLGDPAKARKAFGFAASWTAERGIKDYIGGAKTAVGSGV